MVVQRYSAQDLKFNQGIDERCQVIVSTPVIFLTLLRHAVITMDSIDLLIFDECHHCNGNHPYSYIMTEFYHASMLKPKVFGMTASPLAQSSTRLEETLKSLSELQRVLDCTIVTIKDKGQLEGYYAVAKEQVIEYDSNQENQSGEIFAFYKHYRDYLESCLINTSAIEADPVVKDFLKSLKSLFGIIDSQIRDIGYFGAVFTLLTSDIGHSFVGILYREIPTRWSPKRTNSASSSAEFG